MVDVNITRKRDIGGASNDTRFAERIRTGDIVTLNLSASLADQRFEEGFERIVAYVEAHGDASVPQMYVDPDGFTTGRFVANLRRRYVSGGLVDPSLRQRLEALPGWVWNTKEAKYKAALDHLRRYVATTGNARPPKGFVNDAGFRLGEWVGDQREALTAAKKRKMTPERKAELEALPGWVWGVNDAPRTPDLAQKPARRSTGARQGVGGRQRPQPARERSFERGLELMREYIASHGSADVPTTYNRPEDAFNLGIWAKNQRAATKPGSQRPMTDERRAALEALPGWSESLRWTGPAEQR